MITPNLKSQSSSVLFGTVHTANAHEIVRQSKSHSISVVVNVIFLDQQHFLYRLITQPLVVLYVAGLSARAVSRPKNVAFQCRNEMKQ